MFSVLPHQLQWQTWMYEGQTKKGHQLFVVGNLCAKSLDTFTVNWKGTLEGSLSCFIYHRGIQEGTFAAFFSNVGTRGVIATKPQTKHLQTHSQALYRPTHRTYELQSCRLHLIRRKIDFLCSCHSVSQGAEVATTSAKAASQGAWRYNARALSGPSGPPAAGSSQTPHGCQTGSFFQTELSYREGRQHRDLYP